MHISAFGKIYVHNIDIVILAKLLNLRTRHFERIHHIKPINLNSIVYLIKVFSWKNTFPFKIWAQLFQNLPTYAPQQTSVFQKPTYLPLCWAHIWTAPNCPAIRGGSRGGFWGGYNLPTFLWKSKNDKEI